MHLWRKNHRFAFQKRIPADLVLILGASPIRIPLPPLGAREAQRLALQVAAAMDVEMEGIRRMAVPTSVSRGELEAFLKSVIELADDALALAGRSKSVLTPAKGSRRTSRLVWGYSRWRGMTR